MGCGGTALLKGYRELSGAVRRLLTWEGHGESGHLRQVGEFGVGNLLWFLGMEVSHRVVW